MNYMKIQEGMQKSAARGFSGLAKPVSAGFVTAGRKALRLMPHLTKARNATPDPSRVLNFLKLTGAFGKDLPTLGAAGTKATASGSMRGLGWLFKFFTGGTDVAPGFKSVMGRAGNAATRLAGADLLASLISPSWRNTQLRGVRGLFGKAKDKTVSTIKDVGTAINTPARTPIATTRFSLSGLVNTLNPASGITGGVDWVPQKAVELAQKIVPGEKGKLLAHAGTKMTASALLAAGLVGAYRTAQHIGDLGAVDKKDRPGKNMASQLSTTFEGSLSGEDEEQKKAASEDIMAPKNFSVNNLTATALPLGSMLLAAGIAYKGIDAAFDKIRNKRLDSVISDKEQAIKRLITARARLAKGDLSDANIQNALDPVKDSDVYTKAASQDKEAVVKETVQLFGTLSAAILLASALGGYAYTSAADENNLKYKAYRKALREYAKTKSGMTPITVAPKDAPDYFASIDAAKEQKAVTPRDLPSYNADALNKPISVSF